MTIKLDHINLTVENLEESVDWYGKIFGFELVESGLTPNGTKWGIVAFNDSMICMTESPNRTAADQFENESFHQIYHFGVRVSDKEHWEETLKKQNVRLFYGGRIEYPFSNSWYVHDPSGHEIEVSFSTQEKLQFPKGRVPSFS